MKPLPHTTDDDCGTSDLKVGADGSWTCEGCGVLHGDPCQHCGARGYHDYACSDAETFEDGHVAQLRDMKHPAECDCFDCCMDRDEPLDSGETIERYREAREARAALYTALQLLRACVFLDTPFERDDELTYHFEGYVHDAVCYADEQLEKYGKAER